MDVVEQKDEALNYALELIKLMYRNYNELKIAAFPLAGRSTLPYPPVKPIIKALACS